MIPTTIYSSGRQTVDREPPVARGVILGSSRPRSSWQHCLWPKNATQSAVVTPVARDVPIPLSIRYLVSNLYRINGIDIDTVSKQKYRFQDFKCIMIVAQFVNYPSVEIDAEEFSTCVVKHFGENQAAVEIEVVDFQNDLSLRTLSTTGNIWPLVPKEKYPNVIRVALRMKAMFSSTYLCEASFSSMKFIKNKYRNRLTDEHLDNCIRMATTTYSPNFKKILDGQKEFHSSH